jgi:hypothetical protein
MTTPEAVPPYSGFTMKHSLSILSIIIAAAAPAFAADKLSLSWSQLAQQVEGRRITVTTTDQTNGYRARCLRVEDDGLVVENPWASGAPLKLDRQKVTRVRVEDRGGRQMAHLEERTGARLDLMMQAVFSPEAPIGLVGTPIVGAYFIAATPFCAIADFLARLRPPLDIEIVN